MLKKGFTDLSNEVLATMASETMKMASETMKMVTDTSKTVFTNTP
jgi:hypothetical protein